jgi:hypothetical protein
LSGVIETEEKKLGEKFYHVVENEDGREVAIVIVEGWRGCD